MEVSRGTHLGCWPPVVCLASELAAGGTAVFFLPTGRVRGGVLVAQLGRTSSAERLLGSTSLFRDSSAAILLDSDSNADEVSLPSSVPPFNILSDVVRFRCHPALSGLSHVRSSISHFPNPGACRLCHMITDLVTAAVCTYGFMAVCICLTLRNILQIRFRGLETSGRADATRSPAVLCYTMTSCSKSSPHGRVSGEA